jgi:hypothetical protein
VSIDPPPPLSPPERAAARLRRRRRLGTGAMLLAGLLLAVLVFGDRTVLSGFMGTSASQREAALLELLDGIERSESAMETFNDDVSAALAEGATAEAAFNAVVVIARTGVEALSAVRAELVPTTGDATVDAVREAYLPHLDSWVDFMGAVAERPDILFDRDAQQPYLLLINATATTFREATEAMIATEPGEAVVELAEMILDRGFRGFEGEAEL